MKPGDRVGIGLRVVASLDRAGEPASLLVTDMRRGRRPRWVLKWLPGAVDDGRLRTVLRADILDLACLRHAGLALPRAFGEDPAGRRRFLLRPYVAGSDLLAAAQGRQPREVLPCMLSAAEAIEILHRFGLLHRNLKPSNFIVERGARSGGRMRGRRVVLCDPAWWREDDNRGSTPEPAAPEAREGEFATPATDLYSLGAVFYSLLTGRRPEIEASGLPAPPRRWNPAIPIDLERSVLKLMNPDPRRRYQSARHLVEDLRRLVGSRAPEPAAAPECFIGRDREIERCLSGLGAGERPRAVAVAGEAGIGKSAFLRRLALEAQLDGFRTVEARCYPAAGVLMPAVRALVEPLIPAGRAGRPLRSRWRRCLGPQHRAAVGETLPEPAASTGRQVLPRDVAKLVCEASASRRTLLLVDEVHLADPVTLDVLTSLVREIAMASTRDFGVESAPPSLAVSFRSESPFRTNLRPLLDALESPSGRHLVEELAPLDDKAVEKWLELTLAARAEGAKRVVAGGSRGGNLFAVREALRMRPDAPGAADVLSKDPGAIHLEYLSRLPDEARRLLEMLAVLGRPATRELLADLLSLPASRLAPWIDSLRHEGAVTQERGGFFFRHGSFHGWVVGTLAEEETQALHRRIAQVLESRRGMSVEETAQHWLDSDTPQRGVRPALAAARALVSGHAARRATVFYGRVLELVTAGARRGVILEAAEAYARAGDFPRAIELLEDVLRSPGNGEVGGKESGKVHARIGVFYHRAGNIPKAVASLESALSLLEPAGAQRARLRVRSELAEIASTQGEYDRAEAICAEALRELEEHGGTDRGVRHEEMILLETQAHLRLRRFQYREAREFFERSLRLSESQEAAPEKCLILNNLGILHIQENRFQKAIECYRKAEKLARRLGDEQSLAAIHSNLAVLEAKTGDLDAARVSVLRAARADARCDSRRTRFLCLHSAGMVDHLSGFHASAIERFRRAVELGEELRDEFTVAFDLVYLGECHLFRGERRAARAAFDRATALGSACPPPVTRMVEARSSLVEAMGGKGRAAGDEGPVENESSMQGIGYLDAWNRVFSGWAHRLSGRLARAAADLEQARAFFSRVKVPAGEIHSTLELAACDLDGRQHRLAARRLRSLELRFTSGRGVLKNPMLSARFLAYRTRLELEQRRPRFREAASLLVEAESYLIGRRLRDLEVLTRRLRRRLHAAGLENGRVPVGRPGVARSAAGGLLLTGHLKEAAAELVRRFEEELGRERAKDLRRCLDEFERDARELARGAESSVATLGRTVRCDSIIGGSSGLRQVVSIIRRLAGEPCPVLIRGETGTGKELVARAIHGESPRRHEPLVSVNCAALPPELLEAELFGHARGAFTGADEENRGLLRAAEGGSFFFDEIGEMPLGLQAKLLGVLDRSAVRPVGGTEEVGIDVRFIFSTSRDLSSLAEENQFRPDLFYRLKTFEIVVPPLRERLEDLPELVEHFRRLAGGSSERSLHASFDRDALDVLAGYDWAGNVRELQNVVSRLTLMCAERVRADDVRRVLGAGTSASVFAAEVLRSRPLDELLAQLERDYLAQLYRDSGGDLQAMASTLGIKVRALYDRFKRLGVARRDLSRDG